MAGAVRGCGAELLTQISCFGPLGRRIEMTEHIPDTLNSVEISNKFNSQYKFFKMTNFSLMLQQINGGF